MIPWENCLLVLFPFEAEQFEMDMNLKLSKTLGALEARMCLDRTVSLRSVRGVLPVVSILGKPRRGTTSVSRISSLHFYSQQ